MDEQVNIPALPIATDGVTQSQGLSVFWLYTLALWLLALGKSGAIYKAGVSGGKAFGWSQLKRRD